MRETIRNRGAYVCVGTTLQKLKMSCPQHHKPLPRCVICLVHMRTSSGLQDNKITNSNGRSAAASHKIAEFLSWFTWCNELASLEIYWQNGYGWFQFYKNS
jgi:hypothetical protein